MTIFQKRKPLEGPGKEYPKIQFGKQCFESPLNKIDFVTGLWGKEIVSFCWASYRNEGSLQMHGIESVSRHQSACDSKRFNLTQWKPKVEKMFLAYIKSRINHNFTLIYS